MIFYSSARSRTLFNIGRHSLATTICLLLLVVGAVAQSVTDGSTPVGHSPGAPSGSYSLSGFDNVNLFNGNLNFDLSLLQMAGRGNSGHAVHLKMERKWTMFKGPYFFYARENGWQSIQPGYGAGALEGRITGLLDECGEGWESETLLRLTFTAPDGTEYELRDEATNGASGLTIMDGTCTYISTPNRGRVFVTADGSGVTFISDADITDTNGVGIQASGYLRMSDGTSFRIDAGKVTWVRDANGNRTSFTYTSNQLSQVKDSLGRIVTIRYRTQTGNNSEEIIYKGYGGATRTIRVWYSPLNQTLRTGHSLQTYRQLFPELNGTSTTTHFNPDVVSSVELPDGRRYWFRYNSYGELARVELPTSGAFEYDWGGGLSGGTSSGVMLNAGSEIYRRVVERRVYPDGTTLASRMTVSKPEDSLGGNLGYVIVEQRDAAGALLSKDQHYYHGSASASYGQDPLGYAKWKDGKEWKTEAFASNGTTILRRVQHTWQQPVAGSTWPLTQAETSDLVKTNDPQITQTVTTLVDTNQVTKQTFTYDQYTNRTDVYEYNFGTGAAGSLVRRTHTDYLTTNVVNGTTYDYAADNAIHIRNLPEQVSVYDSAGVEQSRSTVEYDNYTVTANHAALMARSSIIGLDAAFTTSYRTRGNATATTSSLLTNGAVTGTISTYQQYDVAGSVVKAIDGEGNATTFNFTDRFGSPNAEARANTIPTELGSLKSYAFPGLVTNAMNHTVYTQRDYYTAQVVDSEDPNGVTASAHYDDLLDRPTQVIRAADDLALHTQTSFSYDDVNRIVTTTSDFDNFGDTTPLKSQSFHDGLGRVKETRQYEGGTNYIAVQTQFDALGRAYKTSNPFRPWQSETAVWTTSAFDAVGRTISVTTPDNAVVTTAYSGNTVTVTDQAGKKRKSVTDALSRLTQVYEDPTALNYSTTYAYDVLDNLTTVTQGSQTRTFAYDSLKRLKTATNPESGTVTYTYDNNGNLLTKVDARSITTTYVYDALNRNTTVNYSNTTVNPDLTRTYDGATNGIGRLWASYAGGNETTGTTVEYVKVESYDAMGRPLDQRQRFKSISIWSAEYRTQRTYKVGGSVATQTYPSGRTVTYAYDGAGRTSSFTGNLGDGVNRNYATAITYSPFGRMTKEQFGTSTSLYNKLQYNVRGQLWDIRVGTAPDVNGTWNRGALQLFYDQTYSYGGSGADNNGNVLAAKTYRPLDDQSSTWSISTDYYVYDALNRLKSVTEHHLTDSTPEAQVLAQFYTYDRYGNRTIDAAQSSGVNEQQFTVTAANNRLGVPSGQTGTMTYDAAGNLTTDTYSGSAVTRAYDADNRMTSETQAGGLVAGTYTYNADGQRVRRKVGGVETWQIYGMEGELLGEYATSGAATSPQKEYGYRNGQLLITAEPAAEIKWLVSDHLGTPRIIIDKTGSRVNVKRHDYLPFGEELLSGIGGRTLAQGYSGDNVRQKFTSKGRDSETGLDYFGARHYTGTQGRFTGPDRMSGLPVHPQSWNAYTYTLNNPLKFVDPDGLRWAQRTVGGQIEYHWFATEEAYNAAIDSNGAGYEGWAQVEFDESQAYEYITADGYGIGTDVRSRYRLNPDGTHGYTADLDGLDLRMSTDWGAQLLIGSGIRGAMGLAGAGLEAGAAVVATRTASGEMLTGLYGKVSVQAIESAANAGGPSVQVFTRLDQAPAVGKALHMAYEAGGTRTTGQLFQGAVPRALVEQLKRSGLAFEKTLQWKGAAGAAKTSTELQVMPQAARFIIPYLK